MASSLCSSHTGGNVPPPRPPHGTPSARNPARSKPPLDGDLRHTSECFLPAPATPVPRGAGRSRRGSWPALGPRLAGTLARPLGAWVLLLQETGRSSSSPSRGRGAGGAQCPRGPRDAEWGRGAHAARAPAPGESVSIPAFSGTHGDRGQSHSGALLSRPQHPPRCRGQDRDEAHEVCALGAERDKNTGPEIREDSWQAARWPPLPGGPLPGHRGRETLSG